MLVAAPTGRAVDVAVREQAGDRGATLDALLGQLERGEEVLDTDTVVIVDEAGMVGTQHLRTLLQAATTAGTKVVLVGDEHQLAPVAQRGGTFAQLVTDLPWAQRLSQVWRMHDRDERDASLAVREGGPAALRRAVGWYRRQDRLHTGDAVTMADDALTAWRADVTAGRDGLLIADRWEMADAINIRIHSERIGEDAPTVAAARGHRLATGDSDTAMRGIRWRTVVWRTSRPTPRRARVAPRQYARTVSIRMRRADRDLGGRQSVHGSVTMAAIVGSPTRTAGPPCPAALICAPPSSTSCETVRRMYRSRGWPIARSPRPLSDVGLEIVPRTRPRSRPRHRLKPTSQAPRNAEVYCVQDAPQGRK